MKLRLMLRKTFAATSAKAYLMNILFWIFMIFPFSYASCYLLANYSGLIFLRTKRVGQESAMPMYMVNVCFIGVLLACRDGKMSCSILPLPQLACFGTYRLCKWLRTQGVDGAREDEENDEAEHQGR